MKFFLEKMNIRPEVFLKNAGYKKIENPHKNGEESFVRVLEINKNYPRFHIYLEKNSLKRDVKDQIKQSESSAGFEINIHLDMKKPIYSGATAHSAEYNGDLVEKEVLRIKRLSQEFSSPLELKEKKNFPQRKKSFWKSIFRV